MKKILHLTLFLALISAIAGGALAAANSVTSPKIAENKIAVEKANLEKLYPNQSFEAVDFKSENKEIIGVFKVSNGTYVYKMEVNGYKGPITYLVGIDSNGDINGYAVLSQEETAGLGSKVAEEKFTNQLVGNPVNTTFDTIAGATVSSKAVLNGIEAASENWGANFGELGEGGTVTKSYGTVLSSTDNGDGTTTYQVETEGFHGANVFDVTVDGANIITNFKVVSQDETPGIGDAIVESSFTSQFVGKTVSEEFTGDAISGATYSSNSAFDAVKAIAQMMAGN